MSKRRKGGKVKKLTAEQKAARKAKNERRDRAGTIAKNKRQKIVPDAPAS